MKFTKETLRRALRTFIQAAVAYLAANLCMVDFTSETDVLTSALFGLVVSALAAGMSAVMNLEKPVVDEAPEMDIEVDEQLEFDLETEVSE